MVLLHMLYTWDRRTQTFHAGVTYINYGEFDGYDEMGILQELLQVTKLHYL